MLGGTLSRRLGVMNTGRGVSRRAQLLPEQLSTVRAIPSQYKAILLDQFGVLHDGQRPYPGAIEAVRYLHESGRKLVILSNSSRRASSVPGRLAAMGYDPTWLTGSVTSGEVAHDCLAQRRGQFWEGLGRRCIHITWGSRGAVSLEGLGLQVMRNENNADFVLAHGTEVLGSGENGPPPQRASLDELRALLERCAARGMPLIVANPDLVTVDGAALRVMPGTLGREYAALGGLVHLTGKPAPEIYKAALSLLDVGADEVLAIGDSLDHDICGAWGAAIDALFILGGIHAEELGLSAGAQQVDYTKLGALLQQQECWPRYSMPFLQC